MEPSTAFVHAPWSPHIDDRGIVQRDETPGQWICVNPDGRLVCRLDGEQPQLLHTAPPPRARQSYWLSRKESLAFAAIPSVEEMNQGNFSIMSLRDLVSQIPARELSFAAQASALVQWMAEHRFCATCGSPLEPGAEFSLMCSSPECGKPCFPAPHPAVIVAVTSDEDELLLARQPTWPANRLSVIAGFVMPGESLEQAVIREVDEETGVPVDAVTYVASQPWPFPNSLMLAFRAHARCKTIAPKDNELVDIQWISRREMASRLAEGSLVAGGKGSVSRYLIDRWLSNRL
jgi:NAD+ diphosphatase